MSDGKRVFRVTYHGGSLCAFAQAETPERAVEIAKAHREAKRVFRGGPPKEVREDDYDATPATERDIAWARKFGVGVLADMPVKPSKGAPRSRKRRAGAQEGAEATKHPGAARAA